MALVKGIDVQKSRFAALYIGQDSDSDEETGWDVLTPKTSKHRGAASKKGGTNVGQEDVKGLSKNAKKRARKRRNKSTSSDQGTIDQGESHKEEETKQDATAQEVQDEDVWKRKNKEAEEEEFQKKLREALILSTIEARKETKVAEEKTSASSSKPTKKGVVKLSLQELHKMPPPPPPPPPQSSSSSSSAVQTAPHIIIPPGMDPQMLNQIQSFDDPFLYSPSDRLEGSPFSPLLDEVEAEIEKEMTRDKKPKDKPLLSEEDVSMLPRIAQLEDRLEKKDKIIVKLRKEYLVLKKTLTEVKERNQSLCTIMSQGEFSEKAELLKDVNELSSVKDDLTMEIETLSSALEQERSKNKSLKAELTKLQSSHVKTSKHSSH